MRLNLHGYGPNIINLDGEMVSAMIERKVKSKIRAMREKLMRDYVPPSPAQLPRHYQPHQQCPQQSVPVKQEGQVGDDHDMKMALPLQSQQQVPAHPALVKEESQEDGLIDWDELDRLMSQAGQVKKENGGEN